MEGRKAYLKKCRKIELLTRREKGMRNKIILTIVAVLLFSSSSVFAQEEVSRFTDNLHNGYFIMDLSDTEANMFVNGIIDGVGKLAPGSLGKIYPGHYREHVVEVVKTYYLENPDKRDIPVAEALLSGCK